MRVWQVSRWGGTKMQLRCRGYIKGKNLPAAASSNPGDWLEVRLLPLS